MFTRSIHLARRATRSFATLPDDISQTFFKATNNGSALVSDGITILVSGDRFKIDPGFIDKALYIGDPDFPYSAHIGLSELGDQFQKAKTIQNLSFYDCTNDKDRSSQIITKILDSVAKENIDKLCFLRCYINEDLGKKIANFIRKNHAISKLMFEYCSIDKKAIPSIAEALKENVTIAELSCKFEDGLFITNGARAAIAFEESAAPNSEITDALDDYTLILKTRIALAALGYQPLAKHIDSQPLRFLARKLLLQNLENTEVREVSKYWHLPFNQTKSVALRTIDGDSWSSLLGEAKELTLTHNGKKHLIRVATTHRELDNISKEHKHCIRGYTSKCTSGNTHVISIRDEDGALQTTASLEADYREKRLTSTQHRGFKNSDPPEEQKEILSWFIGNFSDRIDYDKLSKDRGLRKSNYHDFKGRLKLLIGFDCFDEATLSQFYQTFKYTLTPRGKYAVPTFIDNIEKALNGKLTIALKDGTELDIPPIVKLRDKSEKTFPKISKEEMDKIQATKKREFALLLNDIQDCLTSIYGKDVISFSVQNYILPGGEKTSKRAVFHSDMGEDFLRDALSKIPALNGDGRISKTVDGGLMATKIGLVDLRDALKAKTLPSNRVEIVDMASGAIGAAGRG